MSLSRAQIDSAQDLAPSQEVQVPEWGGSVFVRMMNAGEHASFGADFPSIAKDRLVFHVLSRTVCGDDGAPLFPGPEGVEALARKGNAAVERLFEAASKLNKLMPADVEAAAKN